MKEVKNKLMSCRGGYILYFVYFLIIFFFLTKIYILYEFLKYFKNKLKKEIEKIEVYISYFHNDKNIYYKKYMSSKKDLFPFNKNRLFKSVQNNLEFEP